MQPESFRSWAVNFEPELRWSELHRFLTDIEAYKLSTQRIPLPPSERARLDKLNIIRTIRSTTGIEGNTLTEEEVGAVLDAPEGERINRSQEEQEVLNARDVLEFIKKDAPQESKCVITEGLIRHIHELTTHDIAYENNIPGHYRMHGARAGTYLTPDPEKIPALMGQFIDFINGAYIMKDSSPVVRAILAHFYLVSIHPFGDGNGRTSRGLEAYILYDGGYNVAGFYSLANFYYKNRDYYIQQLQDARFKYNGGLTEFAKFSLSGFSEELESVQDEILKFVKKQMYKNLVQEGIELGILNDRQYSLLRFLLDQQNMTITTRDILSQRHPLAIIWKEISKATLYKDLRQLKNMGLLVQEGKILRINLSLMDRFT